MENYHYQQPLASFSSPSSWAVSGDQNSSSSSSAHHQHCRPKESTVTRRGPPSGKRSGAGGVKLSTDPQSVAARERRHRISDRFRVLKSLVPGGSKMDTVSMLEEAISYVKFLKAQIWLHQAAMSVPDPFDCTSNAALLAPLGGADVASCAAPQHEDENMLLGYNYAAAASPALAPFPYCSFHGEQEESMLPPVGSFNY